MVLGSKASTLFFGLSCCLFAAGAGASFRTRGEQKPPLAPYASKAKPLVDRFCISCHSGKSPAAGVDFTVFKSDLSVLQASDVWSQAARYLASDHMPPEGSPQPTEEQRARLVSWIQEKLSSNCGLADPGRVTIHRLNKIEYANTVRDIFGVRFEGTADFPSDDVGYGFDNIGDVLSISPLLMEKYLNAAEKVSEKAVVERSGSLESYDASVFKYPPNIFAAPREEDAGLYAAGTVVADHNFRQPGHYILRISAYGDQAGPDPAGMRVSFDGKVLGDVAVKGRKRSEATVFPFPINVPEEDEATPNRGHHKIEVTFTNDYYKPDAPVGEKDRNLIVRGIDIVGPIYQPYELSPFQQKYLGTLPAKDHELEAAKHLFAQLAPKIYRRPVTAQEVSRLTQYVALALKNGDDYERGVQLGIAAALTSPNFLFRVESEKTTGLISGYEIASRLSYFLWSSAPDETLYALAANGSLNKPEILTQQALRMLQDSRSRALSDNFATQWLTLRKLSYISPDKTRFPEFNDELRSDMARETKLFFGSVVDNDRSVVDLLDGKYTYINARLAKLYGIEGVQGDEFRKVSLVGTPRAGVLTQASVLTVTSNPTRTSPVKRGKWVLEEILGTPPPPPPPGVPVLKEGADENKLATLRLRMEAHRSNPACASCHARMDPLGFGLENFDGVGKWRANDEGGFAIDCSGKLPDGRTFSGPAGLIKVLDAQKELFVRCLAEKLMTYALGRGLTGTDQCVLDDIVKRSSASNYKFSSLIKAIVLSNPFRKRGAEGTKA
jgi:PAS domain-containing protein